MGCTHPVVAEKLQKQEQQRRQRQTLQLIKQTNEQLRQQIIQVQARISETKTQAINSGHSIQSQTLQIFTQQDQNNKLAPQFKNVERQKQTKQQSLMALQNMQRTLMQQLHMKRQSFNEKRPQMIQKQNQLNLLDDQIQQSKRQKQMKNQTIKAIVTSNIQKQVRQLRQQLKQRQSEKADIQREIRRIEPQLQQIYRAGGQNQSNNLMVPDFNNSYEDLNAEFYLINGGY